MKKHILIAKIASRTNTEDIIQEHIKTKIEELVPHELSANPQCINNPKNVAVYFKDVKTEETLSSRDQKLVETTNL